MRVLRQGLLSVRVVVRPASLRAQPERRPSSVAWKWREYPRVAVMAVGLGGSALPACSGGSGTGPPEEFIPTHHGVVYGVVEDPNGAPLGGVTVSLVLIGQQCPCEPFDIREVVNTTPTGPDGVYRVHFELVLPNPPAGIVFTLVGNPPSAEFEARIDTLPFGGPATSLLDSTRHDVVLPAVASR
jgi:hypothetical protein